MSIQNEPKLRQEHECTLKSLFFEKLTIIHSQDIGCFVNDMLSHLRKFYMRFILYVGFELRSPTQGQPTKGPLWNIYFCNQVIILSGIKEIYVTKLSPERNKTIVQRAELAILQPLVQEIKKISGTMAVWASANCVPVCFVRFCIMHVKCSSFVVVFCSSIKYFLIKYSRVWHKMENWISCLHQKWISCQYKNFSQNLTGFNNPFGPVHKLIHFNKNSLPF